VPTAEKEQVMVEGRELAFRASGGIEVSLRWHRAAGRLSVVVHDVDTGMEFELPARRDNALDVFYHPFAYQARAAAA
jgi:hypothetical protein